MAENQKRSAHTRKSWVGEEEKSPQGQDSDTLNFKRIGVEIMTALTQQIVDELRYGEEFQVTHDIAQGDFGSSSKDRNETSEFTAPTGLAIIGHNINWSGHHSSASHVKTTQAGQLSYEIGVMAELREKMREGFLKGNLTYKGKKIVSADAAGDYSSFLKEFQAKYKFFAATNSSIVFKWTTHTKNGRFGAKISASADIELMKVASEDEASRAVEMIKFMIESKEAKDVFDLIDAVVGEGKSASEVGLKTIDSGDDQESKDD